MKSPPASGLARRVGTAASIVLLVAVAATVQLATRVPIDADTEYHVAVARLIRAHGLLHAFPWTPFSWLADHYADKELLFHLLMVPFANLPWITCAMIVGTVSGAALLLTQYTVLRAEGIPLSGVWVLCGLASSSYFLVRFALVRPHVLSIALAVLVTWAAARRRWAALAVACFLYPFAYIAWQLPLALAVLVELARALCRERPDVRPPLVAAGAVAAGLLLHPNFPNVVTFSWIVSRDVLVATAWAGRAGFAQGTEFLAPDPGGLARFVALPLAFTAAAVWAAARRREVVPVAFALAAVAFAALTLRSWRFVEYLAPFATVALALALRIQAAWAPPALAAAGALLAVTAGREPLAFFGGRREGISPFEASLLQKNVPAGSQVFTCGWGLTGQLMLALPERRFIVALEPVLMWKKDPAVYAAWFDLVHQPRPEPARAVRETFGARHVLCENAPENRPFLASMSRDPAARLAWRNAAWSYFEIAPAP